MAQPPNNDAGRVAARSLPADVDPQSLSRLSPLDREGLSDEGRAAYDAMFRPAPGSRIVAGLQGPGGVWLRLGAAGRHINEATRILRSEIGLDPRLTELAILAAAREMDNQFQWTMHEPVALREGLSEKIIDVLRNRKAVVDIPETESVIIELAREALGAKIVSAQTYARAVNVFGENGLLNLATLMANYAMTAIVLCVVDQQLHDGQMPLLPQR